MGGFPQRGPEILHSGFDQNWLYHCLRRRWLLALLMGLLVGAATAGLLLWLFPESSSIVAYLRVKSKPPQTVFFDQQQRLTPKDFEIFQQTQLTLLKSQFVLQSALSRPAISQLDAVVKEEPDPVLWLYEELRVSFPGEGEILEVRYDGEEDPEEMKKVVDAVIAAYEREVLHAERIKSNETRSNLGKLHNEVVRKLQDKFDKYSTLAEQYGGQESPTAENDIRVLMSDLNLLQRQLSDAKVEQVDLEVMKSLALQQARSISALETAVQLELADDPMMGRYQEQQFMIDVQIADLEQTSKRGNSPQLKQLRQMRMKTGQDLQQYRLKAAREIRDRLKQAPDDFLSQTMTEYTLRKQASDSKIAELGKERENKLDQLKRRGAHSPLLEMLTQEIEQQKEVEQNIAIRLQSWDIEADTSQQRIQVMYSATSSENINEVQRYSIAGVGGLAALCLTCYGIALMEFGRRRLNGPDQVDEGLGIRVLGSLPSVSSRKAMSPGSAVSAQLSESIDNVRTTLMHDSTSKRRQVILVSSPVTMEGSTTVASHLALSFTRAGRRTLLVDGDIREPSLHKLFGMPLKDGLCEVLRSESDVADAIRATNTEGLWLLTAGECDMDAVHALATDQPQPIVEKLREEFDFIIIDGAPVLGLSDTLSVGQYVDGAILTVLRDQSEIRKVYQAAELLKSLGIRLIGAVVNGVPIKSDRRVTQLHRAAAKQTKKLPAEAHP
jgi:capsular exopolysaccharide synthesis family protein